MLGLVCCRSAGSSWFGGAVNSRPHLGFSQMESQDWGMVVCVQRVQRQGSVARERCMEGAAMRERLLAVCRLGGSKRSGPAWSAWRLIAEL